MPSNLRNSIKDSEDNYFDFALVNLFRDNNFRDEQTMFSRKTAQSVPGKSNFLTKVDSAMQSGYWQSWIFGKISSYFADADSPFDHVKKRAEALLIQEIDYASHLGIERIVIDLPGMLESAGVENMARIINRYL